VFYSNLPNFLNKKTHLFFKMGDLLIWVFIVDNPSTVFVFYWGTLKNPLESQFNYKYNSFL
jgi:hypothetical protein